MFANDSARQQNVEKLRSLFSQNFESKKINKTIIKRFGYLQSNKVLDLNLQM